jgi:hypothetical protein
VSSWITAGDLIGLALLILALAVTGVSAFAEGSVARFRASRRRARSQRPARRAGRDSGSPAGQPAAESAGQAREPAAHVPAQAGWQASAALSAAAASRPEARRTAGAAGSRAEVPSPRQPAWQQPSVRPVRPAASYLVEDRVPGPAALQLEEAVSPGDQ